MEKDYTIFYGVFIVMNILLIGILLGAMGYPPQVNPTPGHPKEPRVIPRQNLYVIGDDTMLSEFIISDSDVEELKKNPIPPRYPSHPSEPIEPPKEDPPKTDPPKNNPPTKPPSNPPPVTPPPPPPEPPKGRAPIIYSGQTNEKVVAITFDDGPNPQTLSKMLDILDQYNARSTFFLLGNRSSGAENLLSKIYNRGHQIANHSYTHPQFSKLNWNQAVSEINRTEEVLGNFMSHKYFRPPYGDYKRETQEVAYHLGYRIIYWDVDTRDWAAKNSKQIVDSVKANTKPGSIILFHEGKDLTIQALPEVLQWLTDQGYTFVTVAELLGD